MIAASALAAAAGAASAQTYQTNIPVRFQVGDTNMAPGDYRVAVSNSSGATVVELFNLQTHQSGMVMAGIKADPPKTWPIEGRPVLTLACDGGACALKALWDGSESFVYRFSAPKLVKDETPGAALRLPLRKGD
ncbi:MAG TPA: hypothetical protein VKX45_11660 [Bryobacteraceae bacterium]|jgi:hypothetical protein|nr:hypothetical protein [Bryobacteraceae bacterium]